MSVPGGYMKTIFATIILTAAATALAQPATMAPREAALPETVSVTGTGRVTRGAGVHSRSGLDWEVSEPTRGRVQGLKAAFADARSTAVLVAAAAGRTLGRAMNITEGAEVSPPPRPMVGRVMAAKAEQVSEVPVESGTQELSFTVSVIFELR